MNASRAHRHASPAWWQLQVQSLNHATKWIIFVPLEYERAENVSAYVRRLDTHTMFGAEIKLVR